VKKVAEIIGYVSNVERGGIEAINCHASDDADRDTHIEFVLDLMHSDSSLPMIVEVTPRWRYLMSQRGIDWSSKSLRDACRTQSASFVSTSGLLRTDQVRIS
jgi:hypothetical protein